MTQRAVQKDGMPMQMSAVQPTVGLPKPRYSERLYNPDLASQMKNWNQSGTWWRVLLFWLSDLHSVGGYVFAASLFSLGLHSWQLLVSGLLGVVLVQLISNLIAKPSQLTGTPFAASARLSFGVYGACVPTLIRAASATVWFGIQTYVASTALCVVVLRLIPSLASYATPATSFLGLSALGWSCFVSLWALQVAVFWNGAMKFRRIGLWVGPLATITMIGLAAWVVSHTGVKALMVDARVSARLDAGATLRQMAVAVGLVVSFLSSSMLRISDCARVCESYSAVKRGNFWGLPVSFVFFAIIAAVTSTGTLPSFAQLANRPTDTLSQIDSTVIVMIGGLALLGATLSLNVITNALTAGFDIATAAPGLINRRGGRVLAALLALMMTPWNLFSSPQHLHFALDVLGAVIAPLLAVLIVDFYETKKQQVKLDALYSESRRGHYWYDQGVNWYALKALGAGVLTGLVISVLPHCLPDASLTRDIAHCAWFCAALVAGLSYHFIASEDDARAVSSSQVIRVRQVL
jgi:nucleobase:cation symporter-1, NCS1 family